MRLYLYLRTPSAVRTINATVQLIWFVFERNWVKKNTEIQVRRS